MKSDLVECVLGLGEGLFYNSPMPAAVVVLRARKSAERRGKVLFIDASREFSREQSQSFLRSSHQVRILDAYRLFANDKDFATVATIDEIAEHSYSLAIPLYVANPHASANTEQASVIEALADWRAAATASDAAIQDAIALLRGQVPA